VTTHFDPDCDTRRVTTATEEPSLQDRFAPTGRCFGCGPGNPAGLRIASRPDRSDETVLVARFTPDAEHEAFEGVVNGGILGTLVDCHANWTAAWTLMRERGADRPPTTVTLEYGVRLRPPTPSDRPVELRARPVDIGEDRVTVEVEVRSGSELTATGRGVFVAVKPDHPAYDRW
jgi:acyl-coenzyme A thioesterase PaaI-like protein